MTWLAKWICGINYEVHGAENLPAHPFIIVSNHQSTWETFAFFKIFSNVCFVLKKELLTIPLFGWALRLLEPIAIDREQKGSALEQVIQQGTQRLQLGRTIIIYPEGKRMPPGHLGKFKLGAAVLAKAANCPIVPVAHDAGRCWRRRGFLKKPGTIHVKILSPIYPGDKSTSEFTQAVVAAIEAALTN
jgi:1-acyl-sn-glycerol-3-phosphate acyltransferase